MRTCIQVPLRAQHFQNLGKKAHLDYRNWVNEYIWVYQYVSELLLSIRPLLSNGADVCCQLLGTVFLFIVFLYFLRFIARTRRSLTTHKLRFVYTSQLCACIWADFL